jgi:hypothetical protein
LERCELFRDFREAYPNGTIAAGDLLGEALKQEFNELLKWRPAEWEFIPSTLAL